MKSVNQAVDSAASVVPVGSCVSETVNDIESIKRKAILVIYRNSSATFAWLCLKSIRHDF